MNSGPNLKYICPNCARQLQSVPLKHGVVWSCTTCKGKAVGLALLQKLSKPEIIGELWRRARSENRGHGKACPACRKPCLRVITAAEQGSVEIDVCSTCQFIWFDDKELEKIPRVSEEEVERREHKPQPYSSATPNRGAYDNYYDDYSDDPIDGLADLLVNWFSRR